MSSASLIGKKLGAYRIESLLGSGGMGDVYRGVHEILGRPVAIKTLKPEIAADASSLKRFFDEARVVNRIRHENIVEVTDLVSEPGGRSYMVMELLEGRPLSHAIRDAGRLPPERAVRIAAQIASAIGAAHRKGIIHRDLKPDNVFLIRRAGSADYVKVLDFGIARLRPDVGGIGATKTGAFIGTPAYMSPEQAEGKPVENTADIYALGVILFHMLTGRLPFEGASMPMVIIAHLYQDPPSIHELSPEVPAALAEVVKHALAKKPADRPASMAELGASLCRAVDLDPGDFIAADHDPDASASPEVMADPMAAPVASGASMWSGPTMDVTGQSGSGLGGELGSARGDMSPVAMTGDASPLPRATALERPARRAAPAEQAALATLEPSVSMPVAVADTGVHSNLPPSMSTGRVRPRIATPRSMPSQAMDASERSGARLPLRGPRAHRRVRLWIAAAVAAVAAGVLSFVLVRALGTSGNDREAAAAARNPAAAAPPGAAAGSPGDGDDGHDEVRAAEPDDLRRSLDRMVAEHDEPGAPPSCQTRDRELLVRLVSAAGKLAQGGPGSQREQDTEAVRILSGAAPEQAEYWYWLAKARLYVGANREAVLDAAERATALCPGYAAVHNVAGTAEFRARNAAAAESFYRRALELDSGFHIARYNLGLVQLELGRIAEGIDSFTRVIDHDPDSADALVARGQAHLMARDPASAARDLERATQVAPQSATAFWLLGHAYNALAQGERARQALCTAGRLGHAEAAQKCQQ